MGTVWVFHIMPPRGPGFSRVPASGPAEPGEKGWADVARAGRGLPFSVSRRSADRCERTDRGHSVACAVLTAFLPFHEVMGTC